MKDQDQSKKPLFQDSRLEWEEKASIPVYAISRHSSSSEIQEGGKITSLCLKVLQQWGKVSFSPRIMDIKDRRHRSLTRGRCGKECRYTSSSLDSEDCRVPTQKSYSSSETLKAYDHDTRMHYGNRVTDLVHRESDEFPRQAQNES
ncbi:TEN2 protein [Podarcis lilfordi]|uniref:TEN2 protein n=1 Tax=Podarcis lilfordi TaxID=74358 RepID=A0AA35JUN9_9SAUR|nr:TEN2 protein [Podarcis lilfordi]